MAKKADDPPPNGGSRPVPDPTKLTDEAIAKADKAIRDWVTGLIAARDERLQGIDRATELRLQTIDHMPGLIDEKITNLFNLMQVELRRIDQQFNERDTRSERESKDNKTAVDAAFAAADKAADERNKTTLLATAKSEAAINETINKLSELFATSNAALADKNSELARRVDRIEALAIGQTAGSTQAAQVQQSSRSLMFAVITAFLSIVAIGAAILAATGR